MIDLRNKSVCPTLAEIGDYVRNPVFMQLCSKIKDTYQCSEKIEYSACSMEKGWNVKFKKAGKALCTIYPRENYFTVMVVVGAKEKAAVEEILLLCSAELQCIYHQTREWNGQRWLSSDLEEVDELYYDTLRLIQIRRKP